MNTTFKFNDALVEVKPMTIGDELDSEVLAAMLSNGEAITSRDNHRRRMFSEFLVTARVVEGSLGFQLPSIDAGVQDLKDAMSAWLELSGLLGGWREALRRVELEKKATLTPSTDGSKAKPEAN